MSHEQRMAYWKDRAEQAERERDAEYMNPTWQERAMEAERRANQLAVDLAAMRELLADAELLLVDVYSAKGREDWFDARDAWIGRVNKLARTERNADE